MDVRRGEGSIRGEPLSTVAPGCRAHRLASGAARLSFDRRIRTGKLRGSRSASSVGRDAAGGAAGRSGQRPRRATHAQRMPGRDVELHDVETPLGAAGARRRRRVRRHSPGPFVTLDRRGWRSGLARPAVAAPRSVAGGQRQLGRGSRCRFAGQVSVRRALALPAHEHVMTATRLGLGAPTGQANEEGRRQHGLQPPTSQSAN